MESREYQELAPSTATLKVEEVLARVNQRPISFIRLLMDVVDACHKLELAKKHILYGKDPGDWAQSQGDVLVEQLATYSQERFRQCFDLIHGAIGMATEAGELLQQVSEHVFHQEKLDQTNVTEELGDISWYMALAAKAQGTPFEQVWAANIAKLRARYPAGVFDEKFCHNRDLQAERKAIDEAKFPLLAVPAEPWKDQERVYRREGSYKVIGALRQDLVRMTWEWALYTSDNEDTAALQAKGSKPGSTQAEAKAACDLAFQIHFGPKGGLEPTPAQLEASRKLAEIFGSRTTGAKYLNNGYAVFDVEKWKVSELPFGFIWVDFFQLNATRRAQLKALMSEDKRYHIGHLSLDPKAFTMVAGTKTCACLECLAPEPEEAQ